MNSERPDQPNILLLLNDHQAFYRHRWNRNLDTKTPNFNDLARQGMRFIQARTPTAICVPARRSLWTGLYPHRHGLMTNDNRATELDQELVFERLREQGYRIIYLGKWHNGTNLLARHGYEGLFPDNYGNPYATPEYTAYVKEQGIEPARAHVDFSYRGRTPRQVDLVSFGASPRVFGKLISGKRSHEAFFLAHQTKKWLREVEDDDAPFCLVVSFWGPHRPYFPSPEYLERWPAQDIPLYPSLHSGLAGKPDGYLYEHNHGLHDGGGRMLQPTPLSDEHWQRDLAAAYAHIAMVDEAGGEILRALDDAGLRDSTLTIWTTDHGDAVASHGGHATKGPYMSEEIYRIPLAIRWPGRIAPEQTSEALVSLVDLAPTMLDCCGGAFSRQPDGRSLLPVLHGESCGVRDALVCEFHGLHEISHQARSICDIRYKAVFTPGQASELYDLGQDPYQLTNRADDPACQPRLQALHKALLRWQKETHDSFACPMPEPANKQR